MMKGRNLNTIADLSSLTEAQVNQLPIRNPKVETVRNVLTSFMNQHGLQKPFSKEVENRCINKNTSPEREIVEGNFFQDYIEKIILRHITIRVLIY